MTDEDLIQELVDEVSYDEDPDPKDSPELGEGDDDEDGDEELRSAEENEDPRDNNEVHQAADSLQNKLMVPLQYAFALGRRAVDRAALRRASSAAEAESIMAAAPAAVQAALAGLLEPVLHEIVVAGGDAGMARLQGFGLRTGPGAPENPTDTGQPDPANDAAGLRSNGQNGDPADLQTLHADHDQKSHGNRGSSLPDKPHVVEYASNVLQSKDRRFLFDPKSERMILSRELPDQADDDYGSHGEDLDAIGLPPKAYDTYEVHGYIRDNVVKVTRFANPREGHDPARWSDSLHKLYGKLKSHGADSSTQIDVGWGGKPIDDAMKSLAAGDTPFKMRFDVTDPNAIEWARKHAAELATDLSKTTRTAIGEAIADAFEGGGDAYDAILEAVGDEARAEMIARTETMIAANQGQRMSWEQAIEEGLLPPNMQREWIATSGACPECEALDGVRVPLDEPYPDGSDSPPLHPNCRCTEGIVG